MYYLVSRRSKGRRSRTGWTQQYRYKPHFFLSFYHLYDPCYVGFLILTFISSHLEGGYCSYSMKSVLRKQREGIAMNFRSCIYPFYKDTRVYTEILPTNFCLCLIVQNSVRHFFFQFDSSSSFLETKQCKKLAALSYFPWAQSYKEGKADIQTL